MEKTKNNCAKNEELESEESVSFSESSDDEIKESDIPRGRPKSGRWWKAVNQRTRSAVKTRGLKSTMEEKMKLKNELKYIKNKSREIIEKRNKEKETKRLRTIENAKLKEQNEKKAEIVQVIKNTAKISKLKKKHLRAIQKRDTLFL